MTTKIFLIIFAMTCLVRAQELPDAPVPAMHSTAARSDGGYDRSLWIATGINAGAKVADMTQTCIVLNQPGGHERWLPTQSCAGVVGFNMAGFAASTFVSWYAQKHGHHKLALAMQYLSAGSNIAGFAYTRAHWETTPARPIVSHQR